MSSDPNAYQSVGWILVGIFALAGGVNQIHALVLRWRGEPSSESLYAEARAIGRRVEELEKQRKQDLDNASERRRLIYAEFKSQRGDFLNEIKDLYARIDSDRKHVEEVLRHLPNELIATLRNTGVIK